MLLVIVVNTCHTFHTYINVIRDNAYNAIILLHEHSILEVYKFVQLDFKPLQQIIPVKKFWAYQDHHGNRTIFCQYFSHTNHKYDQQKGK